MRLHLYGHWATHPSEENNFLLEKWKKREKKIYFFSNFYIIPIQQSFNIYVYKDHINRQSKGKIRSRKKLMGNSNGQIRLHKTIYFYGSLYIVYLQSIRCKNLRAETSFFNIEIYKQHQKMLLMMHEQRNRGNVQMGIWEQTKT